MKIVYPYPMHLSRGYTYMLSIIQFLNTLSNFISVDLLCLDDRETLSNYLEENLGIELSKNLNIIQISNKSFGFKSNKFFFISNTLKHVNTLKHEKLIIYTRDFKQMRLCIKSLKNSQKNIKFIFEAHQILSQNYEKEDDIKNANKMKQLEEYVFNNVDGLVCITSTLSYEIKRIFFNCTKNHLILPIGFSSNFLKIDQNFKKNYDILYSGNFSKWKGLEFLLEAIAIIKKKYARNISALLIGSDAASKKHYESLADELGISKNINILKRIKHKEIYGYINQSRVGVVPTSTEGDGLLFTSPLKLYEYLGSGMKVVSSRLPSIESNIADDLVYYCKPNDPRSLADSIILALEDRNFDSKKVKHFAENFTWEKRAEKIIDFIS